jgi:hypothetical protein
MDLIINVEMKRQFDLTSRNVDVIKSLRKYHNSPTLVNKIAKMCGTNRSDSELLNLHILHLASCCTKTIDVRYVLPDEPNSKVKHQGLVHHLDEVSESKFRESLRIYEGRYTTGVFNDVNDSVASRVADMVSGPRINIISFDEVNRRSDERINLNISLNILKGSTYIRAVSLNISRGGLLVKASSATPLNIGDVISIPFPVFAIGGSDEDESISVRFKVVMSRKEGGTSSVALVRVNQSDNMEFNAVLAKFIQKSRKSSRVDVDNILNALNKRIVEQMSLNNSDSMLFALGGMQHKNIIFGLSTNANAVSRKFFSLVSSSAIDDVLSTIVIPKITVDNKDVYFATFTAQMGKKRAIFACDINDQPIEIINAMRMYARSNKSFKVFKASITSVNDTTNKWGSTLPDCVSSYSNLDYHVTRDADSQLSRVGALLTVSDVTSAFGSEYDKEVGEADSDRVKALVVPSSAKDFCWVEDKTFEQRVESRFKIHESVRLIFKPYRCDNNITVFGETVNISTRGIKVKMVCPANPVIGSLVRVKFPNSMDLPYTINYQVMHQKGDELSLKLVNDNEHYEEIKDYWGHRIYDTIENIGVDCTSNNPFGLDKGFRSLNAFESRTVSIFYKVKDSKVVDVTLSKNAFSESHVIYSLCDVFRDSILLNKHVQGAVCRISSKSEGVRGNMKLYVKIVLRSSGKAIVKSHADFTDKAEILSFLNNGGSCLNIKLRKSGSSAYRYFKSEVDYIKQVNPVKFNQLDSLERMFDVFCSIDDITPLEVKKLQDLPNAISNDKIPA